MRLRQTTLADVPAIHRLYLNVAEHSGGIIRTPQEITVNYVREFVTDALATGVALVIEDETTQLIVAEIHAYQYPLQAFRHLLSDLTIVVHPDYQGQKLGKQIFTKVMEAVDIYRTDILRVELLVRQQNTKAIAFYEKMGFQQEGAMTNRILNQNGELETPISMAWLRSSK